MAIRETPERYVVMIEATGVRRRDAILERRGGQRLVLLLRPSHRTRGRALLHEFPESGQVVFDAPPDADVEGLRWGVRRGVAVIVIPRVVPRQRVTRDSAPVALLPG